VFLKAFFVDQQIHDVVLLGFQVPHHGLFLLLLVDSVLPVEFLNGSGFLALLDRVERVYGQFVVQFEDSILDSVGLLLEAFGQTQKLTHTLEVLGV